MSHRKPTSIPGIYLITNTVSGRVYVGQARNVSMRWCHHLHHFRHGTHNNRYLQRAWDKRGEAAFTFSVVVDLSAVPKTELAAELNRQEALVFALHPAAYNLLHPGVAGHVIQPETRSKLSLAHKAKWARFRASPLVLADMIKRANLWRRSPEGIRFYSELIKARWADPDYHAAMVKAGSEKWDRPGFRDNHAMHLGAAWADPTKREKRLAGLKAAWADPVVRAARLEAIKIGQAKAMEDPDGKMRQRGKKRWANPEHRTHAAVKATETWADPEIRARRCAALKAGWAKRRAARLASP